MGTIYLFHPAGSIPVETFSCKRYGNGSDNGASPALLTAVCQQTTGAQYHFRNSTALSTKTIVSRNRGPWRKNTWTLLINVITHAQEVYGMNTKTVCAFPHPRGTHFAHTAAVPLLIRPPEVSSTFAGCCLLLFWIKRWKLILTGMFEFSMNWSYWNVRIQHERAGFVLDKTPTKRQSDSLSLFKHLKIAQTNSGASRPPRACWLLSHRWRFGSSSISLGVSCSVEPHFHDEFLLLKTSSHTTQLENIETRLLL